MKTETAIDPATIERRVIMIVGRQFDAWDEPIRRQHGPARTSRC
jgi:hypothetical protein